MSRIEIRGYRPGDIGRIAELHGTYYHRAWNFGLYFESKVAIELSQFLRRFDESRDGFWVATVDGEIAGSVSLDGADADGEGARLRWFIADPAFQGLGVGRELLQALTAFCDGVGFPRVYLWTMRGLDAARHLYEEAGFVLYREFEDDRWESPVIGQYFERLKAP